MSATLCVVWFSPEVDCMGKGHLNFISKVIKTSELLLWADGRLDAYGGFDFVSLLETLGRVWNAV
jgi:hypothetical protein